jgi:hypothetical protein
VEIGSEVKLKAKVGNIWKYFVERYGAKFSGTHCRTRQPFYGLDKGGVLKIGA